MEETKLKALWTKLRTDKKSFFYLASGAVGLLLLLLSSLGGGAKEKPKETQNWDTLRSQTEQSLEKRAEKLLSSVAGVGKAQVVVTLDSLEVHVYAKNETAAADGRKTKEVVVLSQSGAAAGLEEKLLLPAVRGVAVSCEGGGSARVRQEVSALLCAAFGVAANRVYVSAMQQ